MVAKIVLGHNAQRGFVHPAECVAPLHGVAVEPQAYRELVFVAAFPIGLLLFGCFDALRSIEQMHIQSDLADLAIKGIECPD